MMLLKYAMFFANRAISRSLMDAVYKCVNPAVVAIFLP